MTARSLPRRTLIASALVASGLLLSTGVSSAAESDVSSIFGRASPPNMDIHNGASAKWGSARFDDNPEESVVRSSADSGDTVSDEHAATDEYTRSEAEYTRSEAAGIEGSHPVTVAKATTNPETASPPAVTAQGDGATSAAATQSTEVVTPTGRYLAVDDKAMRPEETAAIHEENIDGTPLWEGRGPREGIDYHAVSPVHSEPDFDVAEVLGRASPPAPESAGLYFGFGG
jgi:hypothetical protein